MNKILLFIFLYMFLTNIGKSQSQQLRYTVGLSIIKNEYSGDYGNGFADFSQKFNPAFGISVNRFFSKSFDFSLFASFGQISYFKNIEENYNGLMLNNNLFLKYKFANDLLIPERSIISPLIFAGFGTASFWGNNVESGGLDVIFSVGPGIRIKLNDLLFFEAFSHLIFTNKDHRDGWIAKKNDVFFQHGIGLVINIRTSHYHSYQ